MHKFKADYVFAERLLAEERWVDPLDRATNEQLVCLHLCLKSEFAMYKWPKWDLIVQNMNVMMRLRFMDAVIAGKL